MHRSNRTLHQLTSPMPSMLQETPPSQEIKMMMHHNQITLMINSLLMISRTNGGGSICMHNSHLHKSSHLHSSRLHNSHLHSSHLHSNHLHLQPGLGAQNVALQEWHLHDLATRPAHTHHVRQCPPSLSRNPRPYRKR